MMNVYKYTLALGVQYQRVPMPAGAKILRAEFQRGNLCIWALVDPTRAAKATRVFFVAPTGMPLPADLTAETEYLGTVFWGGDVGLVYHVFDLGEEES